MMMVLGLGLLESAPGPVAAIANALSYGCMGLGLWFWLWGTWPLLGNRSVLYKLHGLSVADTLGSMLIIVGLLLKIPREWPLLVLALISLAIWNTVLGYVLAYCSAGGTGIARELRGAGAEASPSIDPGDSISLTGHQNQEVSHDG